MTILLPKVLQRDKGLHDYDMITAKPEYCVYMVT